MTTTYQDFGPGPAPTYYAGQGTNALLELKAKFEAVTLGWLAYRAGRNFYNVHPNVEDSIIHGAHALRRWWVWILFLKIWLFSAGFTGWMLYLRFHDVRGESFPETHDFNVVTRNCLIFVIPSFILGVLVPYCRNVDYSLFKRRLLYQVMRPLLVVVDWVPNGVLYLTVLCILFFPF